MEEMGLDTSNDPYLNVYAPKGAGSGSRGDSKSLTRGTLTRSRELREAQCEGEGSELHFDIVSKSACNRTISAGSCLTLT